MLRKFECHCNTLFEGTDMCETISIRRKLKYIFKKSNENLQFLEDLHILDLPSLLSVSGDSCKVRVMRMFVYYFTYRSKIFKTSL